MIEAKAEVEAERREQLGIELRTTQEVNGGESEGLSGLLSRPGQSSHSQDRCDCMLTFDGASAVYYSRTNQSPKLSIPSRTELVVAYASH
jgi:hypothetical protein